MVRYRNYSRSGNGLLILLAYAIITLVIPFLINMIKKKLGDQQRLLCNKCNGILEVIDKGNLYCKNCKIIKMDRH